MTIAERVAARFANRTAAAPLDPSYVLKKWMASVRSAQNELSDLAGQLGQEYSRKFLDKAIDALAEAKGELSRAWSALTPK